MAKRKVCGDPGRGIKEPEVWALKLGTTMWPYTIRTNGKHRYPTVRVGFDVLKGIEMGLEGFIPLGLENICLYPEETKNKIKESRLQIPEWIFPRHHLNTKLSL